MKKPGLGLKTTLFHKPKLPGKIIIALKALILFVIIIQLRFLIMPLFGLPYLPFLDFLDALPPLFYTFITVILIFSSLLILFKKGNYLTLSLISGLIILFYILSSKPLFGNSTTFIACLLVLIGLFRGGSALFRIQISLLYLGAAINKMFAPDWWNGMYFDFFLRDVFDVSIYQSWISKENMLVAKGLGIATIFSEFLLGVIVLIPKLTRLTIVIGLIFHAGMLVITSGQLSVRFLYIMSAAFLLISNVKIKPISLEHRSMFLATFLKYLDLSDSITITKQGERSFTIIIDEVTYRGWEALRKLFLSSQFLLSFYFLSILLYMVAPILSNKLFSALF